MIARLRGAAPLETMNIRVADPFSPAFERMKAFLFSPFDLGRWFNLGVGAWLAALGSGGGGLNLPSNFGNLGESSGDGDSTFTESVSSFLTEHMGLIVVIVAAGFMFILVLGFLLSWLSARGHFMLLDNLVYERAEVGAPWAAFKDQANSLFFFKAVYGLIAMLVMFPLIFLIVVGGFNYFNLISVITELGRFLPASVLAIPPGVTLGLVFLAVVLAFVSLYVNLFLDDFIVPIMYRQGVGVMEAWSKFLPLLGAHTGSFFLYSVFKLLLSIGAGMAAGALILVTCFAAACLMVIPYVGTVLILPIPVLFRNYSIHFLRQFGDSFDALAGPPGGGVPGVAVSPAPLPIEDRPPQGSGDPANPYNPYR